MTSVDRGSNKDMYLNGSKRTGFEQRTGLPSLKSNNVTKRIFTLHDGRKVDAEHIVISGTKVHEQTVVHELNPRNQEALDENSMQDILKQIEERGVDTEGIAIKRDGKYYLIEGSRRRFCCIKLNADFPLWVLPNDITNEDVYSIIRATQSSRKFSYREVGLQYLDVMHANNFNTNEQLSLHIGVSTESVRKRIQAAQIDNRLISLFPDCEGIPNNFYSRLAKIQNNAKKASIDIKELCDEVSLCHKGQTIEDIQGVQRIILDELSSTLDVLADKSSTKATWQTSDIMQFNNKDQYARISRSGNGRKVRFEFNRLSRSLIDDIERLIKLKLNKEQQKSSSEE
nr:ParB N-terminal domain-containing protein [Providencia rettgeri]